MESAVRIRHFCVLNFVVLAITLGWNNNQAESASIEAKPGKTYLLTKEHGPWMIMVATFGATSGGETEQQLRNANKAAHELVLELRKKGVPAYVYSQKGTLSEVDSFDRSGNRAKRFEATQRNRICVIAGNYPSTTDKLAQKTLKYVKDLKPVSLKDGIYKPTPNSPGPLSRAFLTLNPLFNQEEIAEHTEQRDPLILKLNTGSEYNLMQNKGKFSLIVASFYGNSQTHMMKSNNQDFTKQFLEFDRKIKYSSTLDFAGQQAWELAKVMRTQGIEAYVFHDRYRSIVTVGAFDSEQDPRAADLKQKFCAKYKPNEKGEDVLVAEAIQLKGERADDPPLKNWVMDPDPQLTRVPRSR